MQVADMVEETGRAVRNAEFECSMLEDEADRCTAQCDSLEATIAALDDKKAAIETELEPLRQDREVATRVAECARAHVTALAEVRDIYATQEESKRAEKELERAKLEEYPAEQIREMEERCAELKEEAEAAEARVGDALAEVEKTKDELSKARAADPKKLREKREQLDEEKAKLKDVETRVKDLSDELDATKTRVSKLVEEVRRLEYSIAEAGDASGSSDDEAGGDTTPVSEASDSGASAGSGESTTEGHSGREAG